MATRPHNPLLSERSKKKKKFFKNSEKPFIREFTNEDWWILWAAYKEGSFPFPVDMAKEDLYSMVRNRLGGYKFLFLVEDNNKKFKSGRGPVCLIVANADGWKFEPHVDYFKWASKYNVIRTTLCFLNWISFNKEVGVCVIRSLENTVNLFRYMRKFIGLNYVGMMPQGDIRGNEHIFSLRGKKHGSELDVQVGRKKDNGTGTSDKRIQRDGNGSGTTSPSPVGSDSDTREEIPCV